ncbi:MAG: PEP-CTERM sorting domain-containing protein, partial [Planctomycetes bacterium]|nr:PEP-CTERM sorting domain-containing protein [Planctomycetota bacterium]
MSTIAGLKFNDLDGDAAKDEGEPGLEAWIIELHEGADGTVDATTTTGADGTYSFTGLGAGTFCVREVSQAGWMQT